MDGTMKLVVIRHGESEWNKLNLFTGWTDVDLSEKGHEEGAVAGATHAALEQVKSKAMGFSVGGKIGIARYGEHLCVAIFMGVGVLNLNELCVGLGHRSLPATEEPDLKYEPDSKFESEPKE